MSFISSSPRAAARAARSDDAEAGGEPAAAATPAHPPAALHDEAARHDTPSTERLLYLDGWRGVSILLVLAGHFLSLPGINAGHLGVELFFVLSGRLMGEILFVNRFPLGSFFRRRIARVWPTLFVFAACMAVVFRHDPAFRVGARDLLGIASFTLNYLSLYPDQSRVVNHIWSLSVEEWTYALLGAVAFASRRKLLDERKLLLGAVAACITSGVIGTALGLDYYHVYWRTDVRAASILLSALVYVGLGQRALRAPPWLPIVLGVLGVALHYHRVPDPIRYSVGTLCLSLALATLARLPRWAMSVLRSPVLVQIGLWSFSLYVWQQPFYVVSNGSGRGLALAGACVATLLSFYLVEQPARRFLNRRWHAPRA